MITLFTSGSTKEPKEVTHSYEQMNKFIENSIREIGLTEKDTVLDVFPSNVIAHYTVTAMPALKANAKYITAVFNPFTYLKLFNKYKPTVIALIPRHWEVLKNTKEWETVDMSCVRYMIVGSGKVSQEMIDDFRQRGVQLVANWYGMTEMPPPVFVGYNSPSFDFDKTEYKVEFTDEGELVLNDIPTGDLFDVENKTYLGRKTNGTRQTWKTNV